MSYSTQQDILDFVEDNNVKFVRFAFCDIFGTSEEHCRAGKRSAQSSGRRCLLRRQLHCRLYEGGGKRRLVLRPDLSTVTILPWRPTEGRVMQFFCDVKAGRPALWRQLPRLSAQRRTRNCLASPAMGTQSVSSTCSRMMTGPPHPYPFIDFGGYFDISPAGRSENLRRDICPTMEQMGMSPSAITKAATARTRSTATTQAPSRPPTT